MNNYKYKVIRTWYVTAEDKGEAISKSKQILHKEVKAVKLEPKGHGENGNS